MDRRIACLIVCVFISSFLPSAKAQSPQVQKKLWCTITPNVIVGDAGELCEATLNIYANYVTQVSWYADQQTNGLDYWFRLDYIMISGENEKNTNYSVTLSIKMPEYTLTRYINIIVRDLNNYNIWNFTTITVKSVSGPSFGFAIRPDKIYLKPNKWWPASFLFLSDKSRTLYLDVRNNVIGLSVNVPHIIDLTNGYASFDINFATNYDVVNGSYDVEFIAYTNNTDDRVSRIVRVDIKVLTSEVQIMPKYPVWGDEVTIFDTITKGMNVEWVRLHYSIDNGSRWTTVNMTMYMPDANIYNSLITSQIMGTTVLYYIEASDKASYVEKLQTYNYTVGIPIWLIALIFLIVIAAGIVVSRRKHAVGPPPPPPAPSAPLPPPSPSEENRGQYFCKACGYLFWRDEYPGIKVLYCQRCGALDPIRIGSSKYSGQVQPRPFTTIRIKTTDQAEPTSLPLPPPPPSEQGKYKSQFHCGG